MVAFALVANGAGLLVGATARTPQQSLAFGLLLSLGPGALGGTMMPLDLFPPTMRTIAHVTPHAWAVDGFAELVRHSGGVPDILPQLGVLLAAAAALLALALLAAALVDRRLIRPGCCSPPPRRCWPWPSWRLRRSIAG